MSYDRVFTVDEVQALIPVLNLLVGQQLRELNDIESELVGLASLSGGAINTLAAAPADAPEISRVKAELRKRVAGYELGWRQIQSLGAVVKDPELGLLDFYGRVEGRLVWLCWRYGEDTLAYYHELDAGYATRRPLGGVERGQSVN